MDWLPIPEEHERPPEGAWHFVSDAAAGLGSNDWAGVASLGLTPSQKGIWLLSRGVWPPAVDEARLASKMTTQEAVGLLLPLLSVPEKLVGQHIVLAVDNIGVVFGWTNGGRKGNCWASVLIRALHIVASFLGCTVFVQNVPRLSSAAAVMADSLTCSSTATADVWAQTAGATMRRPPPPLWEWLESPKEDFNLGFILVNYLKTLM
jgi:hypothetical protein